MQNMQEFIGHGGLDELVAFLAVAQAGSFTAAARQLGRDASILSRRVSQLEGRLGVRLLSRTTRRVALTEIGANYQRRIQAVLTELEEADREASDFAASPRGLLRVSLPLTFGRLWIAPLLPGFLVRHPQIRVDARLTDRYVDLVAEGFDVAIRVGELKDSALTARRIASYRYALLAAPVYLKQHGEPKSPAELADHACLGFTSHESWPDWPLKKNGSRRTVRPAGPLISDNSELVLLAAIQGSGIALLPDWLAGPAMRDGRLVEVLPGWAGKDDSGIYAIMPPGRLVPSKTRSFVDEIAQSIEKAWSS
jgi:DNA-binding transcriptional LysR family regulator